MHLDTSNGLIDQAHYIASPNYDERELANEPEVIIIHCISLPPGGYSETPQAYSDASSNAAEDYISRFFCNKLAADEHPYFAEIVHLKVSSHFLVTRAGCLIQYVPTHMRAWHAGESICLGKPKVNDFSVGIELEGLDTDPDGFSDAQYTMLKQLVAALRHAYPSIKKSNLFAHSDIAPGRKPDPGPYFDWGRLL